MLTVATSVYCMLYCYTCINKDSIINKWSAFVYGIWCFVAIGVIADKLHVILTCLCQDFGFLLGK